MNWLSTVSSSLIAVGVYRWLQRGHSAPATSQVVRESNVRGDVHQHQTIHQIALIAVSGAVGFATMGWLGGALAAVIVGVGIAICIAIGVVVQYKFRLLDSGMPSGGALRAAVVPFSAVVVGVAVGVPSLLNEVSEQSGMLRASPSMNTSSPERQTTPRGEDDTKQSDRSPLGRRQSTVRTDNQSTGRGNSGAQGDKVQAGRGAITKGEVPSPAIGAGGGAMTLTPSISGFAGYGGGSAQMPSGHEAPSYQCSPFDCFHISPSEIEFRLSCRFSPHALVMSSQGALVDPENDADWARYEHSVLGPEGGQVELLVLIDGADVMQSVSVLIEPDALSACTGR